MRVDMIGTVLRIVFEMRKAVSSQYGLCETASTTRPIARSLSATEAEGVGLPVRKAGGVIVWQAQEHELRQLLKSSLRCSVSAT